MVCFAESCIEPKEEEENMLENSYIKQTRVTYFSAAVGFAQAICEVTKFHSYDIVQKINNHSSIIFCPSSSKEFFPFSIFSVEQIDGYFSSRQRSWNIALH
jgi:hypothetical protein